MFIFWKQISLVLQIVIVVAAVLLFSFFDPFNLLKSRKLKLENTPVNVQSIREIGQLITAEYYGEVLNSLQQSRIDQLIEDNTDLEEEYFSIHEQFISAVNDLAEDKDMLKVSAWNKKNDLYEYFYFQYGTLTDNPYYQDYIQWLTDKLGKKNEKSLLKYVYDENEEALAKLEEIGSKGTLAEQIEVISSERLNALSADKKFRRRQIVVLGRGWVKAGINFQNFTEDNFEYDEENKTIHLIGLKPEILSCTINPWFIPEKQVKGFEVILVTNKANRPKYMQIVKEETLKKLRNNALEANILEQAKLNAEINLKDFFSLMIEDGINQVILHEDFFSYFDSSMAVDSLTPQSLISIDSLLVSRFLSDSAQVMIMRDSLKYNRRVHVGDSSYRIQRFSSLLTFADDEELSSGDIAELASLHKNIQSGLSAVSDTFKFSNSSKTGLSALDTIWYFPDKETMDILRALSEQQIKPVKPFTTWEIITKNKKYVRFDSLRHQALNRLVYTKMLEQKSTDFELIVDQIKGHVSQLVDYDRTYISSNSANENTETGTIIEINDHTVLYTDEIKKKINERLLFNDQTDLSGAEAIQLSDSLAELLPKNNPAMFIPIRDSVKNKYVFCLSSDCYPIGRYTYWLYLAENDSTSKDVVGLIDKEKLNIIADLDSVNASLTVKRINIQDSVWFFPSASDLGKYYSEAAEAYPDGGISGFFKKTFSKKKYTELQRKKETYYQNLIFKDMLLQKSAALQKTAAAVSEELKFAEKPNVASRR